MSKGYLVVSCENSEACKFDVFKSVEARIEAQFYEREHAEQYAQNLAQRNPNRRVYALLGASSWYYTGE